MSKTNHYWWDADGETVDDDSTQALTYGGASPESDLYTRFLRVEACIHRRLMMRVKANSLTNTAVYELEDDGVGTGLEVQILSTDANTDIEDASNEADIAEDSEVAIEAAIPAGGTSLSYNAARIEHEFDGDVALTMLGTGAPSSARVDLISGGEGTQAFFSVAGDRASLTAADSGADRLGCYVRASVWSYLGVINGVINNTAATTFRSYIDDGSPAVGNQSVTVDSGDPPGTLTEDASNSDALSDGDAICIEVTVPALDDSINIEFFCGILRNTAREFHMYLVGTERYNAGVNGFNVMAGRHTGETNTEADAAIEASFDFTASLMQAYCSRSASGGSAEPTCYFRLDGVSQALQVGPFDSVPEEMTDVSNTVDVEAGEEICTMFNAPTGNNYDFDRVSVVGSAGATTILPQMLHHHGG